MQELDIKAPSAHQANFIAENISRKHRERSLVGFLRISLPTIYLDNNNDMLTHHYQMQNTNQPLREKLPPFNAWFPGTNRMTPLNGTRIMGRIFSYPRGCYFAVRYTTTLNIKRGYMLLVCKIIIPCDLAGYLVESGSRHTFQIRVTITFG